jgi:inorganic triphosphatase YgiF
MKNQEIELKLTLPGGAAELRPGTLQRLLSASAPRMQQLETTYFDTPECWLQQRGMALRVRQVDGKSIQTLKVPGDGLDGLQSFLEFEAEICGNQPVLSAVTDEKLQERLDRCGLMPKLQPLFTTRVKRATWLTTRGDSQIEIVLDTGSIGAEAGESPIAEIELELKSGEPADLFRCAEKLAEDIPVRLGFATKAARGYALVQNLKAGPVKAERLELSSKLSAADAFGTIARSCLDQLRANEAAILESEDDEAVHQFRIAIRRLRAAISAYRKLMDEDARAVMSTELRWLQRQFGPARDLNVLISETLMPIQERLLGQSAIEPLLEFAKLARGDAHRRAHQALDNPRYAVMLLQIYRLLMTDDWRARSAGAQLELDQPVRAFADSWLAKAHKKLVRLGGKRAELSEEELHRLRLRAKKMRYGAQAFASLYRGKRTEKYLFHLANIQDHLGSLNDATVGRQLLVDLIERVTCERSLSATDTSLLQGVVLGWQSSRINHDLGGFRSTWKAFRDQRKFWKDN